MRLNIALAILVLFSSVSSFAAGSRDEELWDAALSAAKKRAVAP